MKVFVSYRSTDRAAVSQLVTDLGDMGHEVWYDQELEGGQLWWQNILDNIRGAELLIFALTPRSLESYPCQLEYNYANALRRHIIPVMLAEGITYSLIPAVLQERQIVTYVKRDVNTFIALNNAIRRLPPAPPLPEPLPEAPSVPISPLAAAREQVTHPALSYEEQVALLYQLKGYLGHEEYDSAARGVLERLSQHPTLYASILRDIELALKTPSPPPQFEPPPAAAPPDPFADLAPAPAAAPPPAAAPKPAPVLADKMDPFAPAAATAPNPAEPNQYDELELRPGEHIVAEYKASFMGGTLAAMAISAVAVTALVGVALIAGTAAARKARERRLTVTSQRLVFQPPAGSNDSPTEIELADIVKLDKAFKLGDPTIKLSTRNGEDLQFSLVAAGVGYGNREAFIKVVQQAMADTDAGG
ncbi:MAG: toll/interleukin-1 receptor domain-containing protein [Anaerolineae bacterium]|nr:toll/interleukin-1 receptor domain-containing protein [Anaerolineae bacterium]